MIQWIDCRYRPAEIKRPAALPVCQVAERFGTNDQAVYYWIDHSVIRSRCIRLGAPHWITLSEQDEQLREWVQPPAGFGRFPEGLLGKVHYEIIVPLTAAGLFVV